MNLTLKKTVVDIRRFFLGLVGAKRANVNLNKPMVSFTFDDFPVSAVINGARILEESGFLGTYYAALGVDGGEVSLSTPHIFRDLEERGHEVGCHTYSHNGLRWSSKKATLADCKRNREAINKMLPDCSVSSFFLSFWVSWIFFQACFGRCIHLYANE